MTQIRQAIVPLVAAGVPPEDIAARVGKSVAQVKRYIAHPEVQDRLREIDEHRMAQTKDQAADIAERAWDALGRLLASEDDRIVLDAAKTVLDRKGHPATSKTEAKHEVRAVEVPDDPDRLRARLARAMARLEAKVGAQTEDET